MGGRLRKGGNAGSAAGTAAPVKMCPGRTVRSAPLHLLVHLLAKPPRQARSHPSGGGFAERALDVLTLRATTGAGSAVSDDFILETENLTKEFAGFIAVNGVSLRVARGTIHALIGPNGAGKTTCFNLLTKFMRPSRAADRLQGARHHAAASCRGGAARAGALVPDLRGLSAPDGAGKRARRAAAQARVARSISGARSACSMSSTSGRWRSSPTSACRPSPIAPRWNCPMAANAPWRSPPPWRSIPEMLLLDEPMAGMGHEDIDRISALIKIGRRPPHGADGRA